MVSDHIASIVETWRHDLFTHGMDVAESMAQQAALCYSIQHKRKAIYLKGDVKFVIKALMKDKLEDI